MYTRGCRTSFQSIQTDFGTHQRVACPTLSATLDLINFCQPIIETAPCLDDPKPIDLQTLDMARKTADQNYTFTTVHHMNYHEDSICIKPAWYPKSRDIYAKAPLTTNPISPRFSPVQITGASLSTCKNLARLPLLSRSPFEVTHIPSLPSLRTCRLQLAI